MARTVIRGATVVSMDPGTGTLPRGDILVDGERIAAVAPAIDAPDARAIDAAGMIAIPGLINAHMHLWSTALRGTAGNLTLVQYFRDVLAGVAVRYRPRDLHIGTLAGALEQIDGGVTTVLDWCHNSEGPEHTDAAIDGLAASGIRGAFFHGTTKRKPAAGQPHYSEIPHPADEIRRLRTGRLAADDARVTLGMAILGPHHSVWDVSEHDLRLARDHGLVASAHMDAGLPRSTPDGVHRMRDAGLISPAFNVVHGNDLTADELAILAGAGASFTVTAECEMALGFGFPATGRIVAAGGTPSIGVDSQTPVGASLLSALRMTLQMQRAIDNGAVIPAGQPPASLRLSTADALAWATINGARALGMEHRIGTLAPGKQADIVLLRADDLNLLPVNDPVQAVVLHATPANVDTVMIAGRLAKQDGRLLGVDLPKVKADLLVSRDWLLTRSPCTQVPRRASVRAVP
ncbi:MAG: amidohydrolase family protein [Alphaproteobacteria bacterium]